MSETVIDEDYEAVISTWAQRNTIPSLNKLWNTGSIISTLFSANVFMAYYSLESCPYDDFQMI